jgi:hypothetical protein
MRLSDPNNDKASLIHRRTRGVAFNWFLLLRRATGIELALPVERES